LRSLREKRSPFRKRVPLAPRIVLACSVLTSATMTTSLRVLLVLSMLVVGCADEEPPRPLPSPPTYYVDGGAVLSAPPGTRICPLPAGPYGTAIGREVEPLTLTACDGGDYALFGADYCDAPFTVIVLVAGWAGPAIALSRELESTVIEPYAPRGVRVITVITQTETYGAPDEAYCAGWEAAYGDAGITLIDPSQRTGIYFPGNALPAILTFDDRGVIRHRLYGYDPGAIPAALDALLSGEEPT